LAVNKYEKIYSGIIKNMDISKSLMIFLRYRLL